MNRRSFLQSILAVGVSPWVMSGGIAGGILMPVRQIVVATEFDIDAMVIQDIREVMARAVDEMIMQSAMCSRGVIPCLNLQRSSRE